jgi:hypothetical protein
MKRGGGSNLDNTVSVRRNAPPRLGLPSWEAISVDRWRSKRSQSPVSSSKDYFEDSSSLQKGTARCLFSAVNEMPVHSARLTAHNTANTPTIPHFGNLPSLAWQSARKHSDQCSRLRTGVSADSQWWPPKPAPPSATAHMDECRSVGVT